MALVVFDRVIETTAVVGTGTATLLGAALGFQSFAVIGDGNTTYYCIADQGGANWEVGIGTYTASGTTLARTTVLSSSNADALVTFTAGIKDVFVTYPSSKGLWKDASGNAIGLGTPAAFVATNITGTASGFTAGHVTTNANLTGGVTSVGNAATVVTNANLTGDITSVGNATTLTNAPVIAKVLTGYVSGAGTVAATDSILQAIQKLNGNDATNANLTGMVTSVGNATTVVTNANLTGAITSSGNAASLGSFTSLQLATALTDETGTGSAVFATSPTLANPTYTGTLTGSTGILNIGSGQVYKDASGNVGIGTALPLGKLQVSGATAPLTGGYGQLNIFSTDAIGGDKGGKISFGGVSGASGYDPYGFCSIAGYKDNATASDFSGYLQFSTAVSGGTVTERMRINSSGNVLVTNPAGLGYGAGSGGTVTQATDKSTGVTLNKPSGRIKMVNTSLAANTNVFFILTNSTISTGDLVLVNILDNAAPKSYQACAEYCRSGYVSIMLRNTTGASLSEDVVLTFAVIKGANY